MKEQYANATRNDERIKGSHKSNVSDISNNTVKSMKFQHDCGKSRCSSTCQSRRFRLTKFELRKFDGNTNNWIGFWCQFQKIDSDETMDEGDRFQYLYQCTVPGTPARELVDCFPPSGAYYKQAIEQLKSRFAKKIINILKTNPSCNSLGYVYVYVNS